MLKPLNFQRTDAFQMGFTFLAFSKEYIFDDSGPAEMNRRPSFGLSQMDIDTFFSQTWKTALLKIRHDQAE